MRKWGWYAFSMFVHDGVPAVMKIKCMPGIAERPNKYGAFNLPAAHMFKILNGKIYEIEAIGYMAGVRRPFGPGKREVISHGNAGRQKRTLPSFIVRDAYSLPLVARQGVPTDSVEF
jgi:hypothetical protein